jgi:hypothetical protein
MTWGFDGKTIVSEQRYDGLGRLSEQDWPRFANDPKYLAKRTGYDNFNRVTSTTAVDTGGAEMSTLTEYLGLTTKQINLKKQLRTETRDAISQLVNVEDSNYPVRGITLFEYEPYGS